MWRLNGLLAATVAMLCACNSDGDVASPEGITYEFTMTWDSTGDQAFRAITDDPDVIARARAQLELPLAERNLFINGPIDRGNGGHNLSWNWHFIPGQWDFAEFTIELCDGNPELVSQSLDYWVDTVGMFCPWGARVSEEIL